MTSAAEIARALGGRKIGRTFMARCPCHADRTPSLALADGELGVLVKCWGRCDARDVLVELRARGLLPARRDDPPKRRPPPVVSRGNNGADRGRDLARRLWRDAHDPRGTLAELYLNSRGLALGSDLARIVLRFHPACPWEDWRTPALVAAFSPIRDDPGEDAPPVAILRVGLDEHGRKIGKKMLGPVAGAAIKIDRDDDVELGLGIAEGLETALAVRAAGWRPVWAIGSAGAVRTFPVLAGIEALTIFADHDANTVGLEAARECAKRWADAGLEAFMRTPSQVGADWADVL